MAGYLVRDVTRLHPKGFSSVTLKRMLRLASLHSSRAENAGNGSRIHHIPKTVFFNGTKLQNHAVQYGTGYTHQTAGELTVAER